MKRWPWRRRTQSANVRPSDVSRARQPGAGDTDNSGEIIVEPDLFVGDPPEGPKEKPRILFQLISDDAFIRAGIALLLLGLLTLILVLAFTKVRNWDEMKELLDLSLPAVTALLGSTVGFYFGTRDRES